MALAERQKRENFEIKFHNLFGRGQVTKKAVVRELECDLLNEVGASFSATEIVFSVNRPGKTEVVEVDGIKLCVDTDVTTTEDNERSIMIRATLKSHQPRNIVVVLNAALQDGVERQILPVTEHHQLLRGSSTPQRTKKIAIMESVSQRIYSMFMIGFCSLTRIYSMFMIGFCSLTVKIRLYRQPLPSPIEKPPMDSLEDDEVVFVVEEHRVPLRRSLLSSCSKFLSAYSQSAMAESQSNVFPIQDCSLSEFQELLAVSRGDREIDEENVDVMLELADRFIMPQILTKCELFLATAPDYDASELLYLADRYRLHLLALFVLNQIHSEDELIALMEFEGFELMSSVMKAVVWKRFHDLTECRI